MHAAETYYCRRAAAAVRSASFAATRLQMHAHVLEAVVHARLIIKHGPRSETYSQMSAEMSSTTTRDASGVDGRPA
jgi:hypothetical protein